MKGDRARIIQLAEKCWVCCKFSRLSMTWGTCKYKSYPKHSAEAPTNLVAVATAFKQLEYVWATGSNWK